jgi:hypothetical protein
MFAEKNSMNKSTLIHNIDPDDFFKRLSEMISETVSSISPKMPNQNPDEILTVEETANYFKKSKDTIERWTKKGFLVKYGIGDSVYYKLSEIEKAIIPLNGNTQ